MVNKQVMHHLPPCGALILALLTGCNSAPPPPTTLALRQIFVAESTPLASGELTEAGFAVHDTAVRELQKLGYVTVARAEIADATLRTSWQAAPTPGQTENGRACRLTFRLYDRAGHRLHDQSSAPTSISFWSTAKATSETQKLVRQLEQAKPPL